MRRAFCIAYFNSQPHKEADDSRNCLIPQMRNFNSQPHKEADKIFVYIRSLQAHFNSQPHKEADTQIGVPVQISDNFNSQPHKEADLILPITLSYPTCISTHSLTRRLTVFCVYIAMNCAFQLTASQGG